MTRKSIILSVLIFFSVAVYAEGEKDRGYWISRYLSVSYPLKSMKVNSSFGSRKDPFTGEKCSHGGIDLKAKYEDVFSMFDGVVEAIGSDKRSGNYIILRHGNYTVSYCHLSRRYVEEGEKVFAGMPVAVSGNTGRSTGAHLHLTVKRNGTVTDPSILLSYITSVRREACKALGGVPKVQDNLLSQSDFIKAFHKKAMEHQRQYGIPASVTLAQMAYESRWGNSQLARVGNNYFGVKCSRQWLSQGRPYSLHDDDAKDEKFCNYSSAQESMEHHAHILMGKRYMKCRKYSQTDYHGWLVALKSAGYATSPDYVRDCEDIIRKYKLYLYDQEAMNV